MGLKFQPKKGLDHACVKCGWAGQPVVEVSMDGTVVTTVCEDIEECGFGAVLAARMDDMAAEYEAQKLYESGLAAA